MLSRPTGSRSRKHPSGQSRWGRYTAVMAIIVTVVVTLSSIKELGRLLEVQNGPALRDSGSSGDWHSVLGKAEKNMETHLPHWLSSQSNASTSSRSAGLQSQAPGKATVISPVSTQLAPKPASTRSSSAHRKSSAALCNYAPHTDYGWGEPVKWGTTNRVDSAEKCCEGCLNHDPASSDGLTCNVWVWCGDKAACGEQHQECWYKHLAHPDAASPKEGPAVPWTAGLVDLQAEATLAEKQDPNEDRSFHIVITAEGTAVHWQSRVHYYWYKKIKAQCEAEGKCQMGGFTRLLHSGKADDLMDEIPSFVVNPLPPDKHDNKGYVVLNRPYAFVQWTQQAKIKEKFVIMSEPDHVWLKPMPNLMKGRRPAGFPFFYIEPSKKDYLHITEKFAGPLTQAQAETIAPIGNAPTMMAWDDLVKVAPLWMNISLAIFNDKEASKEWGWVQEMYAFTIGCYNAGVPRVDLHKKMMSQPPWDTTMDPFYIMHYTYGMDYTKEGVFTPGKYGEWRFDKRTYAGLPPPRNLGEPPAGMTNELVRHLISAINEASSHIPGWDEYAATGVAAQLWDGKL